MTAIISSQLPSRTKRTHKPEKGLYDVLAKIASGDASVTIQEDEASDSVTFTNLNRTYIMRLSSYREMMQAPRGINICIKSPVKVDQREPVPVMRPNLKQFHADGMRFR